MPKSAAPKKPDAKPKQLMTTEAVSWVGGLFTEYTEQLTRYHQLTKELFAQHARVELVEKNLCVTRDHLAIAMEKSDEELPNEWRELVKKARFVGMRLADACLELLQERKQMSAVEMLNALNVGMFRFRTNSPAREIHGALLRQPYVKRLSDGWMWTGPQAIEATAKPDIGPVLRLLNRVENNGMNTAPGRKK